MQYIIVSPEGFLNGNRTFAEKLSQARRFETLDDAIEHVTNHGVRGDIIPCDELYEFRYYLFRKADYYQAHYKLTKHPRDLELADDCRTLANALSGKLGGREAIQKILPHNNYQQIALTELALNKHKAEAPTI